ncbi:ABC-type transport system, ATPase component [Alteracholeplasma palmae J233]|uniref:ABC-type transport system, ATPase component n=1 Tax=Alteracholeplasma palmae (strain ATCC 49389 / J233) TaxID=1318466 RepID=U4KRF8_ALTPJ|nr:ATP-binding cassette domain-containing protein [Alteracholeplasma palmae]CCV64126.1 ABC-type transport system, ATPase component [Alteracholeplasma palmae J233]
MIELNGITKYFITNKEKVLVLDDINLMIEKKDIFGLVGPTGSGKSTLLRILTGFMSPDSGSIVIQDKQLTPTTKYAIVRETSMIFQHFNLLSNLTVLENVALPLKLRKVSKLERLQKAKEVLGFVGLENFSNEFIRTLSGGQKQRVAIARAIITQPQIIFCDEPTSALDEKTTFEILSLLKKINEEFHTTIILVSHDISVIKSMCNKIAILENGRIENIITNKISEFKPISYLEAFNHAE